MAEKEFALQASIDDVDFGDVKTVIMAYVCLKCGSFVAPALEKVHEEAIHPVIEVEATDEAPSPWIGESAEERHGPIDERTGLYADGCRWDTPIHKTPYSERIE